MVGVNGDTVPILPISELNDVCRPCWARFFDGAGKMGAPKELRGGSGDGSECFAAKDEDADESGRAPADLPSTAIGLPSLSADVLDGEMRAARGRSGIEGNAGVEGSGGAAKMRAASDASEAAAEGGAGCRCSLEAVSEKASLSSFAPLPPESMAETGRD